MRLDPRSIRFRRRTGGLPTALCGAILAALVLAPAVAAQDASPAPTRPGPTPMPTEIRPAPDPIDLVRDDEIGRAHV